MWSRMSIELSIPSASLGSIRLRYMVMVLSVNEVVTSFLRTCGVAVDWMLLVGVWTWN